MAHSLPFHDLSASICMARLVFLHNCYLKDYATSHAKPLVTSYFDDVEVLLLCYLHRPSALHLPTTDQKRSLCLHEATEEVQWRSRCSFEASLGPCFLRVVPSWYLPF